MPDRVGGRAGGDNRPGGPLTDKNLVGRGIALRDRLGPVGAVSGNRPAAICLLFVCQDGRDRVGYFPPGYHFWSTGPSIDDVDGFPTELGGLQRARLRGRWSRLQREKGC